MVTNAPVDLEYLITCRSIGASGQAQAMVSGSINNVAKSSGLSSPVTIDTTGALNINVQVQWSAANASNTFSLDQGWLEMLN